MGLFKGIIEENKRQRAAIKEGGHGAALKEALEDATVGPLLGTGPIGSHTSRDLKLFPRKHDNGVVEAKVTYGLGHEHRIAKTIHSWEKKGYRLVDQSRGPTGTELLRFEKESSQPSPPRPDVSS